MSLPTNQKFINELAFRLCLHAGDSWVADDGAQDQWKSTVSDFILEANKVERWQRRPVKSVK